MLSTLVFFVLKARSNHVMNSRKQIAHRHSIFLRARLGIYFIQTNLNDVFCYFFRNIVRTIAAIYRRNWSKTKMLGSMTGILTRTFLLWHAACTLRNTPGFRVEICSQASTLSIQSSNSLVLDCYKGNRKIPQM